MLVPFGLLLPLMKNYNALKTAGLAFLFSLSIETMQPLYILAGGTANRSFFKFIIRNYNKWRKIK